MLRGIPDIIGSDLLKALADTGHGDLIVIADHYYPPYSKSPHAVSIQAKGTGSVEMLDGNNVILIVIRYLPGDNKAIGVVLCLCVRSSRKKKTQK